MYRQFQLNNFLLALATFGLGVVTASLFSSGAPPLSGNGDRFIRHRSESCIAARPSGSERRMYHTERERLLLIRIRDTEIEIIDAKRRNGIYSREMERETSARLSQLEVRLQMLVSQLERLHREESVDPLDEIDGLKLVYYEHCYER